MAETRAEARALRKALGLNNPAAEEFKDDKSVGVFESSDVETLITEIQTKLINTKCNQLGIDVDKFQKKHFPNKELAQLTRTEASTLAAQINKYQTNTEESENIPDEIRK